jgi:hypothetical protein
VNVCIPVAFVGLWFMALLQERNHTASAAANPLDDGVGAGDRGITYPKVSGNTIVQSTGRCANGVIALVPCMRS